MVKTSGYLDYETREDGWHDTIRLLDDDGVPLVMDSFKQFHGKDVLITIEAVPTREGMPQESKDKVDG